MEFTKERFVPGKTSGRVEIDSMERYRFSAQFVKDKKVLDIACGVGYGSEILKESGGMVDGVDVSQEAIDYARNHYSGINFIVSDALTYTPDKKYDVIVSHVTIEQIKDHKSALKFFYNWLIPGGLLIISSPNRIVTSPDNFRHSFNIQEFKTQELADELVGHGFKIENLYGQRFQRYFRIRFFMRVYKKLFNPDQTSSPVVKGFKSNLEPRYFIIKARK